MFDLACLLRLGESFWGGDVEAGYRYQLAPSGITLDELRAAPNSVWVPLKSRYAKHTTIDANGIPRGFSTPSRKLEFYSETLLEHGYTPLPEHREPLIGPLVRPDLGARFHPLADEHR